MHKVNLYSNTFKDFLYIMRACLSQTKGFEQSCMRSQLLRALDLVLRGMTCFRLITGMENQDQEANYGQALQELRSHPDAVDGFSCVIAGSCFG